MKMIGIALLGCVACLGFIFLLTSPHAGAQARAPVQMKEEIDDQEMQLAKLIPGSQTLADPDKRAAIAAEATPKMKKLVAEISELLAAEPAAKDDYLFDKAQYLAYLTVLGDQDSSAQLGKLAASGDKDEAEEGVRAQLLVRWCQAGKDVAAQTAIADEVQKLDAAHPDSQALSVVTWNFAHTAATPELQDRLTKMTLAMTSPLIAQLKQSVAEDEKVKALNEGKPLVLAGKTVDGKDFTTADWKGKVILVDFWATWCGPCVAETPHVKQMYTEFHPKGLELVGVSNDYSAEALKDFTAKNDMPWPQLYNAEAGAQQQWNPMTLDHGINGIPTMFLIDKKGVCRTVDARENMEELIPKLLAE